MRQAAQQTRTTRSATRFARVQPPAVPGDSSPRRRPRRAITLLELLVVMLILLMVTAAAIPIVAPALQNRQMRESTRLVTAFFGAAKARAIQTGRPVGVVIEQFNDQPYALQISQIEVPPPYSGDVVGAKLVIEETTAPSAGARAHLNERYRAAIMAGTKDVIWFSGEEPAAFAGMLNYRLVKVGDQIQLNGQGVLLTIYGPDTNTDGVIDAFDSTTPLDIAYVYDVPLRQKLPWRNGGGGSLPVPQPATYQIFRQPVRTSSPPLVLPEGIVFDLSVSGMGSTLFNTQNYAGTNVGTAAPAPLVMVSPKIIFSPSGRVEWVSDRTTGNLTRPTDPIYLLLGRREFMFDLTNRSVDKDIVFQNLGPIPNPANAPAPPAENFWVVIGHQTGQVNTAQVAPNFQDYTDAGGYTLNNLEDVVDLTLFGTDPAGNTVRSGALTFARESQSLGGR